MPKVNVYNMSGEAVGEIELSDALFGIEPNAVAVHTVVKNYLANQRQGTQSTLTRSEVSGGGRKPWRQKGTGHARQGSIRAPQWYHGGIALGPKPRDYSYTINKKVRRLALKSAFSSKVLENALVVVDAINVETYKTKEIVKMLAALKVEGKALIVEAQKNEKLIKSAANIPGVKTALTNTINVYDIVNADKLVVSKDAALKLEEVYA
ncbi:MAG: 50S ribosomal protein L4 [Oscillospiraceae bacterium]|nr:50S ribosomal protein L4 [Oscillospiraceae bacterium]